MYQCRYYLMTYLSKQHKTKINTQNDYAQLAKMHTSLICKYIQLSMKNIKY